MKRLAIAGVASIALSVAVAGVAKANYTLQGQSLVIDVTAGALDKKKPGPLNRLFVDVITHYEGSTGTVDKKANRTKLYFPKDGRVNTAGLPQCDPNTSGFSTSTTDSAKQICGPSQIGAGSAEIVGPVPGITAVVTAFNGTQPEGLPTVLLHSRTSAGTTTVLIGTIRKSDVAGFGPMLDVPVPALPLGLAIADFKTTVGKIRLPTVKKSADVAKKKKKKKKKPKKYYLMGTCSTGKLNFQAITTYDSGPPTTATASDTCKQKKKKKKKKKK